MTLRQSHFTIPTVVLACALLGGFYGSHVHATTDTSDAEVQQNLRLLTKVYAALEENYADPIDPEKVIYEGAIQGMVRTLDPHSNFVDPKQFRLLQEDRRGRYYGVGMTVVQRNHRVIVLMPFPGSPAHRAGLRPDDIVMRVDDKPCENLNTTEVADLLKGPKGTQVHVAVQREGSEKLLEFDLVRDEIPRPSVELSYEIRPGIGYMKITGFTETTGHEAIAALRRLDPKNLKGFILDLRGNRGGLVTECAAVADLFLQKGQVIVSHHGRVSPEKVFRATHGNGGANYPMIVLIDHDTASASEIVAGALQDHDRALIVGETSFGKGLVQNEYQLSENAGLLLTIARYYTPSGRLIQRKFTGVSLYDYYYYRDDSENDPTKADSSKARQIRMTDSGRTVYGGGGIAPDEKYTEPAPSLFLRRLGAYPDPGAFFDFAARYLATHSTVSKDFEANDAVVTDFRQFLDSKKVPYKESDLTANLDYIKWQIKVNVLASFFSKTDGDRADKDHDPEILRAIELLPRAKALSDNARRVVAHNSQQ